MMILLLLSWPIFKAVVSDWGTPGILLEIEAPAEQVLDTYAFHEKGETQSKGEQHQAGVKKVEPVKQTLEEKEILKSAPKITVEEPKEEKGQIDSGHETEEYITVDEEVEINSAQNKESNHAESHQEEYAKLKAEYSNLLNSTSGSEAEVPAAEGNDNSENAPRAVRNKSMATIGGELTGRTVIRYPTLMDDSQRKGVVVIKICVDSRGFVRTARFTQKGSTTTDLYLVELALGAARNYLFSASAAERQCGTIAFDFQLK